MPRKVGAEEAASVMRQAGLEPAHPYPGAVQPWLCTCTRCGRSVSPRYANVRQGGGGCRYCAGRRHDALPLSPEEAVSVMRQAGLEPTHPYPGAAQPWPSTCLRCGASVYPRLSNVRRGQGGCHSCGLTRRTSDRRRVLALEAEQGMRRAGFQPLETYPGRARELWRGRCLRCGHIVYLSLNDVQKHGCPACLPQGADLSRPADVYVAERADVGAVKVGFASTRSTRLASLRARGWSMYGTLTLSTGFAASAVEHAVHTRLRAQGHGPLLSSADMGGLTGWTKTYDASIVSPVDCWRMLCEEQDKKKRAGGVGDDGTSHISRPELNADQRP